MKREYIERRTDLSLLFQWAGCSARSSEWRECVAAECREPYIRDRSNAASTSRRPIAIKVARIARVIVVPVDEAFWRLDSLFIILPIYNVGQGADEAVLDRL